MSASEGSLGSSSPAAAPPPAPSTPAAAPDSGSPVAAPAAPAAAEPTAPRSPAAAPITPGAPASEPSAPATIEDAHRLFRQTIGLEGGEQLAQEVAPPEAPAPSVVPPPQAEPAPDLPPQEAAPVVEPTSEPLAPVVEPPAEEPVAEELADDDEDDLQTILTPEELQKRFNGRLTKKAAATIAKRDAQRGELLQQRTELLQKVGGQPGIELAQQLMPLIWNDNPTEADAEAVLDLLILPEHAGAGRLTKMVTEHLINTTIGDEVAGPELGSRLISEQWGSKSDGTPYDFNGLKPLELVDLLIRGVQDEVIDVEFLKGELESRPKREPSKRELELQRENEELRAQQQTKDKEQQREREKQRAAYDTQATNWVSTYMMQAVTPKAQKAGWTPKDGEDAVVAAEKKELGELITDHINHRIRQSTGYKEVKSMIDDFTAFNPQTGEPTPRFLQKLEPLKNTAEALFLAKMRVLNPRIAWTTTQSRNAQLVEKNGGRKQVAPAQPQTSANEPPPVRQAVDAPSRPKTTDELIAEARADYRRRLQQGEAEAQVGAL